MQRDEQPVEDLSASQPSKRQKGESEEEKRVSVETTNDDSEQQGGVKGKAAGKRKRKQAGSVKSLKAAKKEALDEQH